MKANTVSFHNHKTTKMKNIHSESNEDLVRTKEKIEHELQIRSNNKFMLLSPYTEILENNRTEEQDDVFFNRYDSFAKKHPNFVIKEYEYFTLALNPNQSYPGRSLLIMKPYYSSPADIPEKQHIEGRKILESIRSFFKKIYGSMGTYELDHGCSRVISIIYDHFPEKSPWPNNVKILEEESYQKIIDDMKKMI